MYKVKGGLTLKMRRRLMSAARSAIQMRSKEPDVNIALQLLERDLINVPLHCFGHHNRCSPDFCLAAKNRLQQEPQGTVNSNNVEDDDKDDSNFQAKQSLTRKGCGGRLSNMIPQQKRTLDEVDQQLPMSIHNLYMTFKPWLAD